MIELKTLKDLYENSTDKEIVLVKELRAEAINIRKAILEKVIVFESEEDLLDWFFNITEEELK